MFQEERSKLSKKTLDLKRAIDSITEELEAVDWYQQRADACNNIELKKILLHNMNEEKEHAAMLIAWLKNNDNEFEKQIKKFINAKDIVKKEK